MTACVTELIFIKPGVKIKGVYYHNVLLEQQLIPAIGEPWLPVLHLLSSQSSSSQSLRHGGNGTWNVSIHLTTSLATKQPRSQPRWLQHLGGVMQDRVYKTRIRDISKNVCWKRGLILIRTLTAVQSTSGMNVVAFVCELTGNTLSKCCRHSKWGDQLSGLICYTKK